MTNGKVHHITNTVQPYLNLIFSRPARRKSEPRNPNLYTTTASLVSILIIARAQASGSCGVHRWLCNLNNSSKKEKLLLLGPIWDYRYIETTIRIIIKRFLNLFMGLHFPPPSSVLCPPSNTLTHIYITHIYSTIPALCSTRGSHHHHNHFHTHTHTVLIEYWRQAETNLTLYTH
jgi:hypothetical protein